MAGSGKGGRQQDGSGYQLMLGDSHSASNIFGFNGHGLTNVPKSKFMFYVKFFRPQGEGGVNWARGIGFVLKSIDRPRITFEQQVLNQYNRKRIVQTSSDFESVVMKFHDTVGEDINNLFIEYYQHYFADSVTLATTVPLYDVTTPEWQSPGEWGFRLPEETPSDSFGYFFSSIAVYHIYNGYYTRFDLVNPKIVNYNPDDLDYASGQVSNEIQMTVNFEGIFYYHPEPLTDELIEEMGLDRAMYFNVDDTPVSTPVKPSEGVVDPTTLNKQDTFQQSGNILKRQIKRAIAGEGISIRSIGLDGLDSFDKNRGVATAKLGVNAIDELVTGKKQGSLDAVRKLPLYGKPGKLF